MCFTMGMSACLATISFASAYYEYRCFRSYQYSLGIAYWGVMESLQVAQHFYAAGPEDNYAMCENRVNQKLAQLGNVHLIFQPLFFSLLNMSMFRRHDIEMRIIGDFLFRLCLVVALWFASHSWISILMGVDQGLLPPATKECPNYQWMMEGYDGYFQKTTPNIPGRPCVFYAPTETGHLAWAIPIFKQTYFFPSPAVHFLLFFFPYLVMFKYPFLQFTAFCFWVTGPYLSKNLTPSVNEQPAIWCFYSVIQVGLYAFSVRWFGLHKTPIPARIHHSGAYGEEPLTYVRQGGNNSKSSSSSNGNNQQNNGTLPLEEPKHV